METSVIAKMRLLHRSQQTDENRWRLSAPTQPGITFGIRLRDEPKCAPVSPGQLSASSGMKGEATIDIWWSLSIGDGRGDCRRLMQIHRSIVAACRLMSFNVIITMN
jgi:hypothetical protein